MVLSDRNARIVGIIGLVLFVLFIIMAILAVIFDLEKYLPEEVGFWVLGFLVIELQLMVTSATRHPFPGLLAGLLMLLLLRLSLIGLPTRFAKALAFAGIGLLMAVNWRISRDVPPGTSDIFTRLTALRTKTTLRSARSRRWARSLVAVPPSVPVEADQVLLRLRTGDTSAIPLSLWILVTTEDVLKIKVAQVLESLLKSRPISRLIYIDAICRARTSLTWSYDWRRVEPAWLIHPKMTASERIAVLGVASCHPSGYLREKVVIALAGVTTGQELPFLLIRANDPVMQVRERARIAILNRLNASNADHIVTAWPLIMRLPGCLRDDHHEIIESALSALLRPGSRSALEHGLASPDDRIRKQCFEILVRTGGLNLTDLLRCIRREPSPRIRLSVLRQVSSMAGTERVEEFIRSMIADRYASIRVFALRTLGQSSPGTIDRPFLEKLVFDKHQAVRDTARYLLQERYGIDALALYRKALQEGEPSSGAIAGLGEMGEQEDAERIAPFLESKNTRIVRPTIKALARLGPERYWNMFILLLADLRPGIAKEAFSALRREARGFLDQREVHAIYSNRTAGQGRKYAALLLHGQSKWKAIPHILEACADTDEAIARIGQESLARWIKCFNRTFDLPSSEQVSALRNALAKYSFVISNADQQWLQFCLKPFILELTGGRNHDAQTSGIWLTDKL